MAVRPKVEPHGDWRKGMQAMVVAGMVRQRPASPRTSEGEKRPN